MTAVRFQTRNDLRKNLHFRPNPSGILVVFGPIGNVTGYPTGRAFGKVNENLNGNVTGSITGYPTGNLPGNMTGNVPENITKSRLFRKANVFLFGADLMGV